MPPTPRKFGQGLFRLNCGLQVVWQSGFPTSISGLSGTPDRERPCVCYADSKMKQKQVGKKRIRMYL